MQKAQSSLKAMLMYSLFFCESAPVLQNYAKGKQKKARNGFGVSKIYIADIMLDTSLKILEWLYNTC